MADKLSQVGKPGAMGSNRRDFMCTSVFQLRIANTIPVMYNAVVGGVPKGPHPWTLQKPCELQSAVSRQMHLLATEWDKVSCSSISIVHCTRLLFGPAVTGLKRRHGRHEIVAPAACSLTADAQMQGAILHYVWIVFDKSLYSNVGEKAHKGHYTEHPSIMWVPSSQEIELNRPSRRKGLNHELKHGLLGLLQQIGEEPYTHKDVDGKGPTKKKLSSKEVAKLISPYIPRLSARFGYRQNW